MSALKEEEISSPGVELSSEVEKSTGGEKKPLVPLGVLFHKLPLELRIAILKLSVCKPACHTFKVEKDWKDSKWFPALRQISTGDPSPYRRWKILARTSKHVKRIVMEELEKKQLRVFKLGKSAKFKAIVDASTDLIILNCSMLGSDNHICDWSEHIPGPESYMDIGHTRSTMSQVTRFALLYKDYRKGKDPFQCRCPPSSWSQHNKNFKHCPLQVACFLDLFRNLENFYFIVPYGDHRTKTWFDNYRNKVRASNYMVDAVNRDGAIEIELYSDDNKNYMRILPNPTRNALMRAKTVEDDPWHEVEDCLAQARAIYRSMKGNELFISSLEQRRSVHFGLLIEYPWLAEKQPQHIESQEAQRDTSRDAKQASK